MDVSPFNSPQVHFTSVRRCASYLSNCWDNGHTRNVNMAKELFHIQCQFRTRPGETFSSPVCELRFQARGPVGILVGEIKREHCASGDHPKCTLLQLKAG